MTEEDGVLAGGKFRDDGIEAETLRWLFGEYAKRGIPYCVLRNHESLPHEVKGADVDIVIGSDDLAVNDEIIRLLSDRFNWLEVSRFDKLDAIHYCLARRVPVGVRFLQFDFHPDLRWSGITWLGGDTILRQRESYNDLFISSEQHRLMAKFLYPLLNRGVVLQKYWPQIRQYERDNSEDFAECLAAVTNPGIAKRIVHAIGRDRPEEIVRDRWRVKRATVGANLRAHRGRLARDIIRTIVLLRRRLYLPSGAAISLGDKFARNQEVLARVLEVLGPVFPMVRYASNAQRVGKSRFLSQLEAWSVVSRGGVVVLADSIGFRFLQKWQIHVPLENSTYEALGNFLWALACQLADRTKAGPPPKQLALGRRKRGTSV